MTAQNMLPPIDRIYFNIAGRSATLRQHATWIMNAGINFVEEEALNRVARMVEQQRLMATDVERILTWWALSDAKKKVSAFLAVIEKVADEKKAHIANARKATSNPSADLDDQMTFSDKEEAAQFITYLKAEGVHGWTRPFGPDKVIVGAKNVHDLYKTFLNSRGDPRSPSQQPPDEGATARLACPGADASMNIDLPSNERNVEGHDGSISFPSRRSSEESAAVPRFDGRPPLGKGSG